MFKNNKFNFSAVMLWFTYFCHGMQAIIISQNTEYFADKWGITTAAVLGVVAWVGIGKIVFLIFSGSLSDKIGRKPVVLAGLAGYVIMFASLLIANNVLEANILAFIGGAMTSLYDGSINPALFEMYPENKSTASVLSKAFISASSILYPLFVAFLATHKMAPELAIVLPLVISTLVLIGVILAPFPDRELQKAEGLSPAQAVKELEKRQDTATAATETKTQNTGNAKPKFAVDGVVLSLFALTIYSNFYLFQQVSKIYAKDIIHMSESAAASVTSLYQMGGLVATIVFSLIMARGIRDMAILIISPIFAGLAGLAVYFVPTPTVLTLAGIVVGFCAAGGLLQMGNAVLNQFFDTNKGRNTSIYYFVMALGSYIVPAAAGGLLKEVNGEFPNAPIILLIIAVTGFVSSALMIFIGLRYKQIFGQSVFSKVNKD
ncbi:MFS transporter [Streptococcus orisasini]|uniref:MFS transporter n=1 Tax=Streptococcus orisasini TaxID=1080071 RepID=UPI0007092E47|nr:MFS transporter [Streptococcus orisasini]